MVIESFLHDQFSQEPLNDREGLKENQTVVEGKCLSLFKVA